VIVDVGAHLDLLDLDDLLVLARLGGLLLVGVFQLAEIEDLDDRRLCIWGNLDEIQAYLFGGQQGIVDRNVAAIVSVCVDKLNPGDPDVSVCARPVLRRRRCLEWSANGRVLLELFRIWSVDRLCRNDRRRVNSTADETNHLNAWMPQRFLARWKCSMNALRPAEGSR
jgi:hypothetical protein